MQIYAHTEAGDRHLNEDAFAAQPHPGLSGLLLIALADGQGGRAGGAEAAKVAVKTAVSTAALLPPRVLLKDVAWLPVIAAADESVMENPDAGYATLVALAVTERGLAGASVGDSAALLRRGGKDQILTDDQRKNPPIGSGAAYPTGFSASLRSPWSLLVMSDGVYRYLGWDGIAALMDRHRGRSLLEALVKAQKDGNRGALGDDFTAVLVEG